jgi:hypothetical protein
MALPVRVTVLNQPPDSGPGQHRTHHQRPNGYGRPQRFAGTGLKNRLPVHPNPATAKGAGRDSGVGLAGQRPLFAEINHGKKARE